MCFCPAKMLTLLTFTAVQICQTAHSSPFARYNTVFPRGVFESERGLTGEQVCSSMTEMLRHSLVRVVGA